MSNSQKIEEARRRKEEGNLLFKNGKYQRAGKKYDKVTQYLHTPMCVLKQLFILISSYFVNSYVWFCQAADYISDDEFSGDDEQKLAKQLQVSCWLNGAACSLKLNDFQGAIKLCSKVVSKQKKCRPQKKQTCYQHSYREVKQWVT